MYLFSCCKYGALNIFYKYTNATYRQTNRDSVKNTSTSSCTADCSGNGCIWMKQSHFEKYIHSQHMLIPAKNFYNVYKLHNLNLTLLQVKTVL